MTKKQTSTVRQHIIGEAKLAAKIVICFLSVWFMLLLWAFTGIYFWFLLSIVLIVAVIFIRNQGLFQTIYTFVVRRIGRKKVISCRKIGETDSTKQSMSQSLQAFYLKPHKSQKTLEQVQKLNHHVQKQAYIRNNRAIKYWQKQQYEKAITEWKEAIKTAPSMAELHHNLANAYLNLERYDKAIKIWEKTIESHPNFVEAYKAYNNLGCAYFKIGEHGLAMKNWQKALELNPDCEEARKNLEFYE